MYRIERILHNAAVSQTLLGKNWVFTQTLLMCTIAGVLHLPHENFSFLANQQSRLWWQFTFNWSVMHWQPVGCVLQLTNVRQEIWTWKSTIIKKAIHFLWYSDWYDLFRSWGLLSWTSEDGWANKAQRSNERKKIKYFTSYLKIDIAVFNDGRYLMRYKFLFMTNFILGDWFMKL